MIQAISLDREDIEALVDVAHHYEDVMGLARYLVVATAPPRIRRRYRYILQESRDLEYWASEWLQIGEQSQGKAAIDISLPQAVALWGRLLSNLRTKRSRRRLSKEQLRNQE